MYFKKNLYYRILKSTPHLIVNSDRGKVLLDTGFNGTIEKKSHAGIPWIGTKYMVSIGECLIIDYKKHRIQFKQKCQKGQIDFTESNSCFFMPTCAYGPIIAVPLLISKNGKVFKANAFVDTGSPQTMILRSRMHKNIFKTLQVDECKKNDSTVEFHVQGNNVVYKRHDGFKLTFDDTPIAINSVMIACGKHDEQPTRSYNDALGNADLGPHVNMTLGNDALRRFSKVEINFEHRTFNANY